jgi:hypothetical protein
MHRRLAAIGCHWKIWRLWMTIIAVEQEQGLSLVDDWRHCCSCSWLKALLQLFMTEGIAAVVHDWKWEVQLQWDVDNLCSHIRLCRHSLSIWCSTLVQANLSLATSPLMLQFSFDNEPLSDLFLYFSSFFSISAIDLRWGNLLFILVHAW